MRRLALLALLIPLISAPCAAAADPSGDEPPPWAGSVTLYAGDVVVVRLKMAFLRLLPEVVARDAAARAWRLESGDIRLAFEANGPTSIAFSSELGPEADPAARPRRLYFHMFYYHGPNSEIVAYDQCPTLAPGGSQRVVLPGDVGKLIFENMSLSPASRSEC